MKDHFDKRFLDELAGEVIHDFADKMDRLWIIFPNRRAGLFFTRELSKKIDQPIWSPTILSFEDFIYKFSDYTLADRLILLLDLYEVYHSINPIEESFDNFYFWGELLLKDFDEVDKYLVNADDLFVTLKNLKEIDFRFQFFSDEQREAIESFWTATLEKPSESKKNFIAFWQSLKPIYRTYTKKLGSQGYGYQGMIYRHVLEKAKSKKIDWENRQVLFAGFNALAPVEEELIKWFIQEKNGRIYWDLDAYYFDDPVHEAGLFLRKYFNDPVFRPFFPKKISNEFQRSDKKINTISASQYPGQARIAGNIIYNLLEDEEKMKLENTVIVLPDESLLSALLYALPDNATKINITMGYPVINSSLYSLFEQLIQLQEKARRGSDRDWFNHRNVINILNHPFVSGIAPDACRNLLEKINRSNMIYVPADLFFNIEDLRDLFQVVKKPRDLFDYLMDCLVRIRNQFSPGETRDLLFEKEFALVIYKFFNRLRETFLSRDIPLSFELIGKVIRSYARHEKIPFTGEPLEGLQIMGFLETRNLDFENVIMLGVNEGFYPRISGQSSFIPQNVRKAFQLPTVETQDSIYSYLFYRLIQRARNIYLIYNSEDTYNRKAEPSRYIYQLKFESDIPVCEHSLVNNISIQSTSPVRIFKDNFILNKLERYVTGREKETKNLTPSMLNLYLNCPLSFCYRYVYDVKEKEEVTEDLDAAKFGLILHKVMEYIYKSFEGKMITSDSFSEIRKGIIPAITHGFAQYHGLESDPSEFHFAGKNLLGREIIYKYVNKILDYDQANLPFQLLGLEVPYHLDFPVMLHGQKKFVSLGGIIDRLDAKDGTVRIIDYKSGKDLSTFKSVESLFDRADKYRNKAIFQTFLYALLYIKNHPDDNIPLVSGLYNFKELHSDSFDIKIKIKTPGNKLGDPLTDIRPWMDKYQTYLSGLIQEIFDPSVPFEHDENGKECFYCTALGVPSVSP